MIKVVGWVTEQARLNYCLNRSTVSLVSIQTCMTYDLILLLTWRNCFRIKVVDWVTEQARLSHGLNRSTVSYVSIQTCMTYDLVLLLRWRNCFWINIVDLVLEQARLSNRLNRFTVDRLKRITVDRAKAVVLVEFIFKDKCLVINILCLLDLLLTDYLSFMLFSLSGCICL